MEQIKIKSQKEITGGVEFVVDVDGTEFVVELSDNYYQALTNGKHSKEELIIEAFKFLLDREPKESILKKFNLKIISRYFPEFGRLIKNL